MVCSNCGQELNNGIKFCTKCGAKLSVGLTSKNNIFSYLSLVFSVIGIIGIPVLYSIYLKNYTQSMFFSLFLIFRIFIFAGIILALISLYKQKNKLALIAGFIPCVYFVLGVLTWVLPFLGFLRKILFY